MLKKLLIAAGVAALLAGCGSNVKLDPPIQGDGAATSTTGAGTGANAQGAGQSSVTQVQAGSGGRDMAGPAGVGKVVYFDYDSFVVKPDYQPVVEAHARFLQADRNRHVVLEGNTDERGSREYNLALGQKRADVVKQALVLLGAKESQIESVSLGEEKPRCEDRTENCYAENRRGDMLYTGEF